jgi:starch-binding outer membrane protein, SusD/RagB family
MKNQKILLLLVMAGLFFSCNENEFLKETPLDFLSGNNSYKSENDFNAAMYDFYRLTRSEFYGRDEDRPMDYIYGTDLVFDGEPNVHRHTNMTAAYNPIGAITKSHWDFFYTLISQTNIVISRLDASELSNEKKKVVEATAKFFRGLSYRTLAYLYGGVPIVLEEVKTAKLIL